MSEFDVGLDVCGMKCQVVCDGGDWVILGFKYFIFGVEYVDFFIVFVVIGVDDILKGFKKWIICFFVD